MCAVVLCLPPLFAQEKRPSSPSAATSVTENTRQIYRDLCSDCHGSDGLGSDYRASGIEIPDFSSKVWAQSASESQLRLAILLGKGDEMPPFENEITSQDATQLVLLIRGLAGIDENPQAAGDRLAAHSKLRAQLTEFRESWGTLSRQWESKFESFTKLMTNRLVKEDFREVGRAWSHNQARKAD